MSDNLDGISDDDTKRLITQRRSQLPAQLGSFSEIRQAKLSTRLCLFKDIFMACLKLFAVLDVFLFSTFVFNPSTGNPWSWSELWDRGLVEGYGPAVTAVSDVVLILYLWIFRFVPSIWSYYRNARSDTPPTTPDVQQERSYSFVLMVVTLRLKGWGLAGYSSFVIAVKLVNYVFAAFQEMYKKKKAKISTLRWYQWITYPLYMIFLVVIVPLVLICKMAYIAYCLSDLC
eukprot:gnl/Spiro4/28514_TR14098_c0_g1_i1.p1 gnl/Spiro4/28514_TR14098_c0_g1~~gnl/Spiro4/28514_TR14098_c0_g1_i1.p1  ORF type:complete len:230 (+),score=48.82 gnl/Spiro4/28514_TR14098_c0_g1_i1:137-826(+)